MWLMWVFTVASDTYRAAAISALDSPAAMCTSTSASRGVSPSGASVPPASRPSPASRPGAPGGPVGVGHREPVTAVQRVKQPSLDGRVELRVPRRHVGNGAQDLIGAGVLGQETAGAR